MQPKIELDKTRDLGETITDSLAFARQNYKPLIKYVFLFCGFFMVLLAAVVAIQQLKIQQQFTNPYTFTSNEYSTNNPLAVIGVEYFLVLFFAFLNYTSILVTVICFISLYKAKGNNVPSTEEMWGYIKFYYFKSLGTVILLSLLNAVGFAFCIIPGIYLLPIFGLIIPIMIIENTSFGYAFNRSFILIKENWWLTFGCIFVISIIVGIGRFVVSIPILAIQMTTTLFHIIKGAALSHGLIIFSAILSTLIELLLIIPFITVALCYFNLTETKDGVGLIERINKLGSIEPEKNSTEEEY